MFYSDIFDVGEGIDMVALWNCFMPITLWYNQSKAVYYMVCNTLHSTRWRRQKIISPNFV